jgi:hypothetical protein
MVMADEAPMKKVLTHMLTTLVLAAGVATLVFVTRHPELAGDVVTLAALGLGAWTVWVIALGLLGF